MATISTDTRDREGEVIYTGEERRVGSDRRVHGHRREDRHEEKTTTATLVGGSTLELLGGATAVVLAIIGLTGYLPLYMTSIATIAIGGALLAHGAAVAARWNDHVRELGARDERAEVGGGIGAELLGGLAGIVLGILALADVMPLVLLSAAAIAIGGSILLGAPAQPQVSRLVSDRDRRTGARLHQAVEATSGVMALVGIGAVVLGILALIEIGPPLTLVMIAMLGIGGALLLTGSALTARFGRRLHQVA